MSAGDSPSDASGASPIEPVTIYIDDITRSSSLAIEQAVAVVRKRPGALLRIGASALLGRAHFRRYVDAHSEPDVSSIPYDASTIERIRQLRARGRPVKLDALGMPRTADAVARHLGIFSGVSDVVVPGRRRRDHPTHPQMPYVVALARSLRIHQWAKNLLLFIPLFASHRFSEAPLARDAVLGFIAFSGCASSVYLVNDLLDLSDDRRHPTKRNRPLARGLFPVGHALAAAVTLLTAAVAVAAVFLPLAFVAVLVVYYGLSLSYSLSLKRIVMVDVVVLSILYTMRVIAGAIASAQVATFWLLAFCVFIFLSLAFLKRYSELWLMLQRPVGGETWGRGYRTADFELLASLGGAAGYISVLVLALYINDPSSAQLYRSPHWLWPACVLLLFWLSRAWLFAHRGEMPDDPIVFALSDGVSRWIGVAFVASFAAASWS